MRSRWRNDKTFEFTRVSPGHQLATLYGKGVAVDLRHRDTPLRLNIERSLDGLGWVVTPAYFVGGVEQPGEVPRASAQFIERELIYGPHASLAEAKTAVKDAWRGAYCRAAVPRLRAHAEKLRREAQEYDERADQYVALYGEQDAQQETTHA